MTQKEVQRMLITQIERTTETRADLIGKGHRFPDIYLFDISELTTVGITDYAEMPIGQRVPCRFWAHYTLSEKRNKSDNPYKDLAYLEPLESQAQPPAPVAVDLAPLLVELRAIRVLLERMVTDGAQADADPPLEAQPPVTIAQHPEAPRGTPADNGAPINDNDPHLYPTDDEPAADPHRETDKQADMREFYNLAGPAIRDETLHAEDINQLVRSANLSGWDGALKALRIALAATELIELPEEGDEA